MVQTLLKKNDNEEAGKVIPLHVRTLTGLESLLAKEVESLGALNVRLGTRVVHCEGDLSLLYKINLYSRTAIRVLRPLASFQARDEKGLYEGIHNIDWSRWMRSTGTLAIDADVFSSFTTHSLYVAQLAKDAIVDGFRQKTGNRPSVDLSTPDLRIVISLFENKAQVFLDSSGESLHKRGYRLKTGEAPLSEALAAGIIKLSEWDGAKPLLDPMCGSGTLLIEAGLLLRNIAPGLLRKNYSFQQWPDYDKSLFDRLFEEAKRNVNKNAEATLIGIEKDADVAQFARDNVERAGLKGLIKIETADFFSWNPENVQPGVIVMNPPYDERLSIENVGAFYQAIGDRFKQAYGGWTAHLLSANAEAIKCLGLRTSKRTALYNGGLESRLVKYELRKSDKPREANVEGKVPFRVPSISAENPQWAEKALVFGNRLRKNFKHLSKEAQRAGKTEYRVYDWDIPEFAFYIDVSGEYLKFENVPRNTDRTPFEQGRYLELMARTAADITGIAFEKVKLNGKPSTELSPSTTRASKPRKSVAPSKGKPKSKYPPRTNTYR